MSVRRCLKRLIFFRCAQPLFIRRKRKQSIQQYTPWKYGTAPARNKKERVYTCTPTETEPPWESPAVYIESSAPSTIILRLIFVLRASREFPFPCVCGSYRKVGHVTCRKLSSCFFKKKEKRAVGDTHMLAKPRMSRFLLLLRQPTTEQPSSVTDKPWQGHR
jgi:hypothetical protein